MVCKYNVWAPPVLKRGLHLEFINTFQIIIKQTQYLQFTSLQSVLFLFFITVWIWYWVFSKAFNNIIYDLILFMFFYTGDQFLEG